MEIDENKIKDLLILENKIKNINLNINSNEQEVENLYGTALELCIILGGFCLFNYFRHGSHEMFAFFRKMVVIIGGTSGLFGCFNLAYLNNNIGKLKDTKRNLEQDKKELEGSLNILEKEVKKEIDDHKKSVYLDIISDYSRNPLVYLNMAQKGVLGKFLIVNFDLSYEEYGTIMNVLDAFIEDDMALKRTLKR